MSRNLRTAVVAVVVATIASVSPPASLAGKVPGVTGAVRGAIAEYQLAGSAVQIVAVENGQCRALRWVPGRPAAQAHVIAGSRCASARTPVESKQMAEAALGRVPEPVVS